jgi:hypothetical protein
MTEYKQQNQLTCITAVRFGGQEITTLFNSTSGRAVPYQQTQDLHNQKSVQQTKQALSSMRNSITIISATMLIYLQQ